MNAVVVPLPGVAAPPEPTTAPGLNLSAAEVQDASGGYVRPADQLRELHARGFIRAFRRNGAGPVILERGHYNAVVAGQFGGASPKVVESERRQPLPPNRSGFLRKFGRKAKGA